MRKLRNKSENRVNKLTVNCAVSCEGTGALRTHANLLKLNIVSERGGTAHARCRCCTRTNDGTSSGNSTDGVLRAQISAV